MFINKLGHMKCMAMRRLIMQKKIASVLLLLAGLALLACSRNPPVKAPKPAPIEQVRKDRGACNARDVKIAIHSRNKGFPEVMDGCASAASGNAAETTQCLKEKYKGLSVGCASCFGKMANCVAKHCALNCVFNHFSEGCMSCAKTECQAALLACTGLKKREMPPSTR
jgi:hypothetical protein